MQTIRGYRRENGKIGIRNHLLILPTVICANQVCSRVQQQVPGSVAIPHQHGCSQVGADKERTHKVLVGMGKNPNVGAVLIVSLGCEVINAAKVKEEIESTGKPVIWIDIQNEAVPLKRSKEGLKKQRNS
ncbi:altronate dehydratase [Bacillus niacini]|uniref:Altronate dehydratase n=1 Tax=Neobacillus niacini TaxID=86668 RepID=A0A852T650_9BACI|nr:altronate dehydratase [Neobacillus niacini]